MKSVLIVDDEVVVRRALKRAFERHSFDVILAEDGLRGLHEWKTHHPDLVVLDILMPGLSGPQVLEEMTDINQSKVVLISAYSGEYDLEKAKKLGADLFFEKPFENVFEVVDKMKELVDGRKE